MKNHPKMNPKNGGVCATLFYLIFATGPGGSRLSGSCFGILRGIARSLLELGVPLDFPMASQEPPGISWESPGILLEPSWKLPGNPRSFLGFTIPGAFFLKSVLAFGFLADQVIRV
jgi:hypothetical protein